jgi:hypothetical protein
LSCQVLGGFETFHLVAEGDGGNDGADVVGTDGGADANHCVADFDRDPKNCGRCAHDCLGGECTAGKCQPVLLARDVTAPNTIAVDQDWVFFTARAPNQYLALYRVPKSGGSPTIFTTELSDELALAVDDAGVYVVQGGSVVRFAKDGPTPRDGGAFALGSLPVQCDPCGCSYNSGPMALDGTAVYTQGYAIPLTGVPDGGLGRYVGFPIGPFAIDDARVYFMTGGITSVPKTGLMDAGTLLVVDFASALAVDATQVYWANSTAGAVRSAPKARPSDGGTGTSLAVGQDQLQDVAVDANYVYWAASGTGPGGGVIGACPLTGCPGNEHLLASLQARPMHLATDAVAIYWTNGGGNTVMKVAKP